MRRDEQRLHDILEALDWIAGATAGRTEAEFLADETLCYAVAQRLTVAGEAADIHWPLVWQTAVDQVPVLRGQIAEILRTESFE